MASLCKRLQCTNERRGFRQELDSWRYKLIHCIGIESILKGLFGPGLIKDLTLFKDSEPDRVCDWSFNENCLFCSLRRDKVKEHFINNQGPDRTPKSLLLKDQATINKLEKQVEEFLNAVVFNKDLPSFTDPHVPVVAREIIQRMIRQFASDYTSTSSSLQGSTAVPELPSDTGLLCLASLSEAPPASFSPGTAVAPNQSPVLSKLLMHDQDSPLDLTIRKPSVDPTEQDGVLDLSLKKGSPPSIPPVHSPHLLEKAFKGKSPEFCTAKAKELQSTSTLKQFMAKLCPHHQKQIVGALGYLQTEVKTVASSTSQVSNNSFVQQSVKLACPEYCLDTPEKPGPMLPFPSTPTTPPVVLDAATPSSFVSPEKIHFDPPENPISLKTSCHGGPPLDLCTPASKGVTPQALPILNAVVSESRPASEHAPVKIKIMKSSNVSDGKKLSCIVSTSLSPNSDSLGERQSNSDTSSGAVTHSARLSSPVKRRGHYNQDSQKGSSGFSKEIPSTPSTSQKTSNAALLVSPMTARKTIRGSSYHKNRDGLCRIVTDPDLGHYDIVYVNRPITECLRVQQHRLHPRRNARKSTRGHLYVEEMWELKTVRTLASRKERDSFHTAMPELVTPVTPKQILASSDRLPHCDMPSSGLSSETEMVSEQPGSETPNTGYLVKATARETDPIVETSHTDKTTYKEQNCPSPSGSPLLENDKEVPGLEQGIDKLLTEESIAVTQLETESESELYNQILQDKETEHEGMAETVSALEAEIEPIVKKLDEPETTVQTKTYAETISLDKDSAEAHEILSESVDEISCEVVNEVAVRTEMKPSEGCTNETAELSNLSEEAQNSETIPLQEREASHPAIVDTGAKDMDIEAGVNKGEEKPSDIQELTFASLHVEESKPLPEDILKRQVKNKVSAPDSESVDIVVVPVMEDNDVSSKTLEALLKELPPWRRKRGALQSTTMQVREVPQVIVGYVNGRPIAASDRSLRRRSNKSSLEKCEPCITEKSCPNSPLTVSVANPVENCGTLSKQLLNTNDQSTGISFETEQTMVPPEISSCSVPDDPSKSSLTVSKIEPDPKTKQVQQESTELGQSIEESFPSGHLDQPGNSPSSPESGSPLKSAQQELAGASSSPPIENDVASSAMVDASIPPPSTDLSSPLPISSPHIAESSPPVYVVSSPLVDPNPSTPGLASSLESVIQENAKEGGAEVNLAPDVELDTAENTEVETEIPNRQQLRSDNLVNKEDSGISERVTPTVSEEVSLSDSSCGVKTEVPPPSSSLRCKRIVEPSKVTLLEGAELSSSFNKKRLNVSSRSSITADKFARMPLRSETGKVLGRQFATLATQSVAAKNRKSFLRYLRSATPSSSFHNDIEKQKGLTPIRVKPGKTLRTSVNSSVLSVTAMLPSSSTTNRVLPVSDPPKLKTTKYSELLNSEEHQQMISNLNSKFDKMQRGWVQMDREGQPAPKHKNKADRQAAIWKSKTRRTRRPKSQEHQRYSPVQMLFMKNFDLTSICRWFFESTETKSLVIVKKVNTRLPSETQLCFHSSSNVPGSSQGVFPSLQAERLKKHLKKFAVASPVKSNAKSQKLIAKALEQEASVITEMDKAEPTTAARISTRPQTSAEAQTQMVEIQKGSAKSKNPTSARILRKYTNIREKMQVQQTSMKLKETPRKSLKATNVKTDNKSKSKLAAVKKQKGRFSKGKDRKGVLVAKAGKGKMPSGRKSTARAEVPQSVIKTNKDDDMKCSLRPGTPQKTKSNTANTFTSLSDEKEVETPKKLPNPNIASGAKTQTKRWPQGKSTEVVPAAADQVLTRSQSKLEAGLTPSVRQKAASNKIPRTAVVQRGSPKSVFRRRQLALAQSATQKLTTKRTQEECQGEVPAKRTRMLLPK